MQRNFDPMKKQVEAWQRSELTDVTAKVVIYEAFIEGKLEAPKHLARTVHDLYFEPKFEEFQSRTIWSLSNANLSEFLLMTRASNRVRSKGRMRVAVEALRSSREPHLRVYPEQMLAMLLKPGSIEMGWRRSDLTRFAYSAGEIILSRRYGETWARSDGLHYLSVAISDAALRSACN